MNEFRRHIAGRYLNEIKNDLIKLPTVIDDAVPVWHIFGLRCFVRDELEKYLNAKGIGTNKHYPIPIHLQKCYEDLGLGAGSLPISEEISRTELSIPMYYGMTDEEVSYVVDALNDFGKNNL
jgi:dTDP-4-amino-4,6-dideoxygalactose transaminase